MIAGMSSRKPSRQLYGQRQTPGLIFQFCHQRTAADDHKPRLSLLMDLYRLKAVSRA